MKRKPAFLLLNQPAAGYDLPLFEETGRIPKIIHQTYHSKDVPDEIAENIVALKTRNPEWEYRLYDDDGIEKYIEANYGQGILDYYHRINPVYGAAFGAMAILFAHLSPALEIVGITTVFGNTGIDNGTANALTLVDLLDADIPVARGAERPLVREPREPPAYVHGADGLGGSGGAD